MVTCVSKPLAMIAPNDGQRSASTNVHWVRYSIPATTERCFVAIERVPRSTNGPPQISRTARIQYSTPMEPSAMPTTLKSIQVVQIVGLLRGTRSVGALVRQAGQIVIRPVVWLSSATDTALSWWWLPLPRPTVLFITISF